MKRYSTGAIAHVSNTLAEQQNSTAFPSFSVECGTWQVYKWLADQVTIVGFLVILYNGIIRNLKIHERSTITLYS